MKKLLITTGAALALMTAPALAQTGYVGGSYVNSSIDTPLGEADGDGWALEGAVALDTGSTLGVTLNGAYADNNDSDGVYSVGGHLYGKGASTLFGGFASIGGNDDNTIWSLGGEGQYNLSQASLAAAIGYASADDIDADVWGIDGRATFFPSDNLSLSGKLGWANVDLGVADDSAFSAGVGLEWQLDAAPISLIADYTHTAFDDTDIDVDAFRIGARFNFGGGTLKARNASGADFATLSSVGGALTNF